MSQPSSATSSFTVVCPGCGQRLRFALGEATPARLRIRCASCGTTFGVRRPGADAQTSVTMAGEASPTLDGIPVPAPVPATAPKPGAADPTSPLRPHGSVAQSGRPRPESEPAFSPGEMIGGRYRVIRFLARGGMGEVYKVEDQELRDVVALKTIRADVAGDEVTVERFRREIQLARKVTHPNVCRIFDVAFHGGLIFLTMELLDGETLGQKLRQSGPLSTEEALPIARQIADALDAAHRAGIVHRDLKPGNVVLAESRGAVRAVVTDFGLARLESGEDPLHANLTVQAGVIGTPAYLAPEQVEGKEITAAVDIYALGIVLYEMVTGKVPFVGETALSVAIQRLREAPSSPRIHRPDLDPRWEAAILRCLERDPAARFATAPEVVQAIAEPERAVLPPAAEEKPAPARTGNRKQLLALAALVLVALAVGWVRYLGWRAEQDSPEHRLARLTQLAESATPRRSVAVLGFKNLSGAAGTEWLSNGLADMLSTELGTGGGLRIIPGESVARARLELGLGDADSLARDTLSRLHAQLGTDAVVLGSYAMVEAPAGPAGSAGPAGRKIRLDLRLQDTLAGETTATVVETGSESEIFDLVARAGRKVRDALGATAAAPKTVRAALPASPEAARLYSEGMSRLRQFEPAAARELLERAVAADPGNALAHSGLAAALSTLGYDEKAKAEAKRAFDLSESLPQEDRLVIEGRYREAAQEWDKAVEIYWSLWSLFPDSLDHGLRLAAAQTAAGQVEEALATTGALRGLPPPANADPRIDLAEAVAAGAHSDFQRERAAAARAAGKGTAQKATLMVAQARLMECQALRNLGQAAPALAACSEGQRLYAARGDRAGVAEALTHAANVRFDRGELDAAAGLYEEALATYRDIGNRGAEAGALNNMAVVLRRQGDLDRASALYEEVLAISREIGSKAGQAYALNNLAGVHLLRGRLDDAGQLFEQALAVRREQGDQSGVAYALDSLGVVLRRKGDLAGARQKHEEALRLRHGTGQKISEVASLNNLGTLALDQGDLAAARKRFEASLVICDQTGSRSSRAYALFGLGEILAREGKPDEARKRHEEALTLRDRLGEKGTAAESRLALAILRLDAGDPAGAGDLAAQAAAELERQGAVDGQALALAVAATAAGARGDNRQARAGMEKAQALLKDNQDLRARLQVQLRAAHLQKPSEAEKSLNDVIDQATKAGFAEIRMEAGLTLAGVEQARGHAADAQARRAALEKEAREKGYVALAARCRQSSLPRPLERL